MSELGRLFGASPRRDEGEHWLSVSDLMAGLMMVFLLISVAFMLSLQEKVDAPVTAERRLCQEIEDRLGRQFTIGDAGADANASTEQGLNCLTVRFPGLDGRFPPGEVSLSAEFKRTLNEFFPIYLDVLQAWESAADARVVKEVRIEGHTSSDWQDASDVDAYFLNMALSQGRTRSVLEHVYEIARDRSATDEEWVKNRFRAVGYSSSQPVTLDGNEDRAASRRVLFRAATNLEDAFRRIVDEDGVSSSTEMR